MEHTPGPWVVEKGSPLMVVAKKGGMAVIISDAISNKVTPLDKANAKLIAAAPDLLAALRDALMIVESVERNNDVIQKALMTAKLGGAFPGVGFEAKAKRIRAALDKAQD